MNEAALSQLYLKDTAFNDLMQRRIFNVLLISSPYDAFMLEEDGRVEERLFFEYTVYIIHFYSVSKYPPILHPAPFKSTVTPSGSHKLKLIESKFDPSVKLLTQ